MLSKKPASVQPPSVPFGTHVQAAAGLSTEPTGVRLMSTETTLAGGSTLALGDKVELGDIGISFALPTGWEIGSQDKGSALILNKTSGMVISVRFGGGDVTDVKKLYNALFEQFVAPGLTKLQTNPLEGGELKPEAQKNFDSAASQAFAGDAQTQQGSLTLLGVAEALLNSGQSSKLGTKAGTWVFLEALAADESAFKTSGKDMGDIEAQIMGLG